MAEANRDQRRGSAAGEGARHEAVVGVVKGDLHAGREHSVPSALLQAASSRMLQVRYKWWRSSLSG